MAAKVTHWRSASSRQRIGPRSWFVPVWLLLCALACSRLVAAQAIPTTDAGKAADAALVAAERVRTTLVQLAATAGGSFGDEGPQVAALVEALAAALSDADRAIRTLQARPDPASCTSHVNVARALFAIGRTADARAALDTGARVESCVDALALRGLVHLHDGEAAQAAAVFGNAWQRDRANPVVAYWLLHSDRAIVDAPEGQRAIELLRAAYAAARTQKAAGGTRRFLTLDVASRLEDGMPVVLPVDYMRGYTLLLDGQRDAALEALRRAAAADPLMSDGARTNPDVAAGIAALRQGRLSQARDRFTLAVARDPDSSEAHRLLATAYWLERDLEPCVRELEITLGLRPEDERSRLMLARVFDEMGRLEQAEALLLQTLQRLPQSGLARLWLAVVSRKLNRDADMARLYATVAAGAPLAGRARLFAMAGSLYQNAGDSESAFAAFLQSVRADPNAPDLHAELARAHLEYERRDAAFAEYVAALLVDPADPNAYLGIGQLALDAGRPAEAVVALDHLVALQPGYAAARHMLGNALMRVGRTEEGARQLAEFERLEKAAADQRRRSMASGVIREEALVRAAQGDVARAQSLWKQLIQLEPDVAAHHAALGALLLDAGQPREALVHLERAAALGAPPDVFRRLAIAYNALGRTEDGVAARVRYESAVLAPARAEPGR